MADTTKRTFNIEECLYEREKEQRRQENARKFEGKLVFENVTLNELKDLYEKWDYQFKPKYGEFIDTYNDLVYKGYDFQGFLEEMCIKAYYSHSHPSTDIGFVRLACLIYLAMAKGMKTQYDHILNSDKDFEYKLNHLDLEK
jgi:hypothetical protein